MKIFTKDWYENGGNIVPEANLILLQNDTLPDWYKNFTISDCKIVSNKPVKEKGDLFEIVLDNSGGFCKYNKIIFKNYIIKENCNIFGSFCIEHELYHKKNGRFEYHLLLQKIGRKNHYTLDYFTINCEQITVQTEDTNI